MAERKTIFRGLNTEVYPDRLPEGTADVALNVTVRNGDIERRLGFDELSADVTGAADAVLSMTVAHFGDGDVYLACKCEDGKLWQRKIYPTDAGSFSEITTNATHSALDAGWWFMWADRLHYFDRGGGSRWNPDANSGVAYKAGLPRPSGGCLIASAAGGEKDGRYHVHMSYRKVATREEGVISGAQTGAGMPLQCSIASDTGGILITNWATIKTQDSEHEWDQAVFYCTKGNTEYIGKGGGVECFSYRAYEDVVAEIGQSSVGLNKSDEVLDTQQYARNSGGEPPPAQIGCWNGRQAVYAGIFAGSNATLTTTQAGSNNDLTYTAVRDGPDGNNITIEYAGGGVAGSETVTVTGTAIEITLDTTSSTAAQVLAAVQASAAASALVTVANAPGNDGTGAIGATMSATALAGGSRVGGNIIRGRIEFSILGFPTMVPQEELYNMGGDAKRLVPHPWVGSINSGIPGEVNALAAGGGITMSFTATAAYQLLEASDGRLWPVLVDTARGAVSGTGVVGTPQGVYALGSGSLTRFRPGGFLDIAARRLGPTLEAIPAAQQEDAVLGWYGRESELWCAVTKPAATVAQQIIVYSEQHGQFWIFEPAGLGVAGITAMCELAVPNAYPTMLVGTSDGRVLQWPGSTGQDDGTGYRARWRGYFGQTWCHHDQRLQRVQVHSGANVADNVTMGLRAMRMGDESLDQKTVTLTKTDMMERHGADLDVIDGNFFQIEFSSADTVTDQWKIRDLALTLERT